jgi:hypothetical protein
MPSKNCVAVSDPGRDASIDVQILVGAAWPANNQADRHV